MVSGYTFETHSHSSQQPLKEAMGRFNLRAIVVSTLLAPLFRVIDTIGENDFYIQAVAVDKELRGQNPLNHQDSFW